MTNTHVRSVRCVHYLNHINKTVGLREKMNTAEEIRSVSISPDLVNKVRTYIFNRFLIRRTQPSYLYVDTADNQRDLQKGAFIGILISKFKIDFHDAVNFLDDMKIHLRYWSGQEVYEPNYPFVVEQNHKHHLNLWKPSEVKPDSSLDASPFIDHLKMALDSDEEVNFVLDFVSFRYQNPKPKSKPHHALYLFSDQQGQGKSLFKDTLEKVFGESAVRVSTNVGELTRQSAYQFWSRTLLFAEEVKVGSDTRLYDSIKAMSGANKMNADPKHRDSIEVEIPAQLIMLSNREPLFIEDNDRRFFIAEWDTGLRGEEKSIYFEEYINWLNNGGYEAIAGYLGQRDLSGYKISQHVPTTLAKQKCLENSIPLPVQELMEFLDGNPETLVFRASDLSKHLEQMPTQQQSIWLEMAGLSKGRKAITPSRPMLYWRKGCTPRKKNGEWVCPKDGRYVNLKSVIYLCSL